MQQKAQAHEEKMQRAKFAQKQEEQAAIAKREAQLEQLRTQEEKQRTEYRLKRELDATADKTRLKLETQRQFSELEARRVADEERLARVRHQLEQDAKEQEFRRDSQLRLQLEKTRAQEDRETQLEMQQRQLELDMKRHNQIKDWLREKELDAKRIDAEADVRKEELKWQAAQDFFAGHEGRRRLMNAALFVALSVGGFFLARNVVTPFLVQAIRKRFFKPKLVSRRVTYNSLVRTMRQHDMWPWKTPEPTVVLPPSLRHRMEGIVTGTKLTASRHGYFSHMMLYGKPGTGKTLFAEKLALESHMNFAVMSGPSFAQFEPGEAITEIKNLFQWANASRQGLLLFIDEADSFLEDRATMNPSRVAVLNEWINQTGTESKRFMCIYETNRPEVIDPAVQSRVTRSIEFPTPDLPEILEILTLYIRLYLQAEGRGGRSWFQRGAQAISVPDLYDAEVVSEIAKRLTAEKFVGRDISNLVIALSQTAYASHDFSLSMSDIHRVVDEQINKKRKEHDYLATREARLEHYRMHARVTV